jgi:hypothetical protein
LPLRALLLLSRLRLDGNIDTTIVTSPARRFHVTVGHCFSRFSNALTRQL